MGSIPPYARRSAQQTNSNQFLWAGPAVYLLTIYCVDLYTCSMFFVVLIDAILLFYSVKAFVWKGQVSHLIKWKLFDLLSRGMVDYSRKRKSYCRQVSQQGLFWIVLFLRATEYRKARTKIDLIGIAMWERGYFGMNQEWISNLRILGTDPPNWFRPFWPVKRTRCGHLDGISDPQCFFRLYLCKNVRLLQIFFSLVLYGGFSAVLYWLLCVSLVGCGTNCEIVLQNPSVLGRLYQGQSKGRSKN